MSADDILTVIDEAHDQGFALMAHCNGAEAALTAARAGVESIEHGAFLSKEALHAMADAGTVWIPTLAPIANLKGCGRFPDKVLEYDLHTARENIKYAVSIGIPIGAGSDAGAYMVPHVQGTKDEYRLLSEVLGEKTEEVLSAGEARLRKMFE
jgi:imidazolonepropionase-like amidohydrolase